ncbi:MAG: signal peptide peptidase SppA [Proteobacteria bacterium]|nr:signal peptide peptidase SppA [Pseudomonadota bacterium]
MSIRKTLVNLFSMLWRGVDGLRKVLHLFVLLFLFAIVFGALSSTAPSLPSKAALIIAPAGGLVEQLDGDPYDRAIEELLGEEKPQTLVQNIIDGLRFAKDDARIRVVVLELDHLGGGGFSKLERVADALDDFRESGKPVIATASSYSQGAYYLAAHASEIYMHPDGLFLPEGFGIYGNYYKNALDMLKIDWNVFRVGTYKSAVEPFLRTDMSDEDRSSKSRLIDQLWDKYQADVVAARGLEQDAVSDYSNNLLVHLSEHEGDFAETARELGFIDDLVTHVELQRIVVEYVGSDDTDRGYQSADLDDYLAHMRLFDGVKSSKQNVAIVVAAGEILNGSQSPGTIGGESTAKLLRRALRDDAVKAVVLRVDSPGGSAFASEQIRNEVEALRAAGKPVVASMSSVAASGGYWISMAADRIYARETTITGSIGIFGMFPTFQRTLDAIGITTDGVGSTPWSGQFRVDREMSDDAKQLIQTVINHGYDDFISKVAEHRNMDKKAVDTIAQGQVWTGRDALELGLIDGIGDLEFSIEMAAELAGLEAGEYGTRYIEKSLSPTEQFALDLMSSAKWIGIDLASIKMRSSSIERLAGILEDAATPLLRFNDPKGMYAYCFCTIE